MKLLAIDTSTEACSAALHIEGETLSRYELAPKKHAELILPMVDRLLAEAHIKLADLDAIAFGRGPGSFTGVRIAVGMAQGFALSADLPLIPVSSLATLAQAFNHKAAFIAAAFDARMGEIYYGLYRSGEVVELVGAESVLAPDRIVAGNIEGCFGAGSGWASYTDTLKKAFAQHLAGYDPDAYPDARDMIPLALRAWRRGELKTAEEAAPVYLRDKVTG